MAKEDNDKVSAPAKRNEQDRATGDKTDTQRRATPESVKAKNAKDIPPEDAATRESLFPTPAFQGSKSNDEVAEMETKIVTPQVVYDAPMHEPEDTIDLTSPAGTKVTAHKDQADTLKALGYK